MTARQTETELVDPGRSPFPGPWRVKAVVEDRRPPGAGGPPRVEATLPEVSSAGPGGLAQALERLRGGTIVDAFHRLLHALRK